MFTLPLVDGMLQTDDLELADNNSALVEVAAATELMIDDLLLLTDTVCGAETLAAVRICVERTATAIRDDLRGLLTAATVVRTADDVAAAGGG